MKKFLAASVLGILLVGCASQTPKIANEGVSVDEVKESVEVKEEILVDKVEKLDLVTHEESLLMPAALMGRDWSEQTPINNKIASLKRGDVSLTAEEQRFMDDILAFYERYGAHQSFEDLMASLGEDHQVDMPVIFYYNYFGREELIHFPDWQQFNFDFPTLEDRSWFLPVPYSVLQRWRVEVVPAKAALNELLNVSISDSEQPALLVVIDYIREQQQHFDSLDTTAHVIWPGMPFELVDTVLSLAEPVLIESSDVDGVLTETFRWTHTERILDRSYYYVEVTFENGRTVYLTTNIRSRG